MKIAEMTKEHVGLLLECSCHVCRTTLYEIRQPFQVSAVIDDWDKKRKVFMKYKINGEDRKISLSDPRHDFLEFEKASESFDMDI